MKNDKYDCLYLDENGDCLRHLDKDSVPKCIYVDRRNTKECEHYIETREVEDV